MGPRFGSRLALARRSSAGLPGAALVSWKTRVRVALQPQRAHGIGWRRRFILAMHVVWPGLNRCATETERDRCTFGQPSYACVRNGAAFAMKILDARNDLTETLRSFRLHEPMTAFDASAFTRTLAFDASAFSSKAMSEARDLFKGIEDATAAHKAMSEARDLFKGIEDASALAIRPRYATDLDLDMSGATGPSGPIPIPPRDGAPGFSGVTGVWGPMPLPPKATPLRINPESGLDCPACGVRFQPDMAIQFTGPDTVRYDGLTAHCPDCCKRANDEAFPPKPVVQGCEVQGDRKRGDVPPESGVFRRPRR